MFGWMLVVVVVVVMMMMMMITYRGIRPKMLDHPNLTMPQQQLKQVSKRRAFFCTRLRTCWSCSERPGGGARSWSLYLMTLPSLP